MSIKNNLTLWETSKRIVASCEYGKKIGDGWSSNWKNLTESKYWTGPNDENKFNYIVLTGKKIIYLL